MSLTRHCGALLLLLLLLHCGALFSSLCQLNLSPSITQKKLSQAWYFQYFFYYYFQQKLSQTEIKVFIYMDKEKNITVWKTSLKHFRLGGVTKWTKALIYIHGLEDKQQNSEKQHKTVEMVWLSVTRHRQLLCLFKEVDWYKCAPLVVTSMGHTKYPYLRKWSRWLTNTIQINKPVLISSSVSIVYFPQHIVIISINSMCKFK